MNQTVLKQIRRYMNEYINYAIRLGLIKNQSAKNDIAKRFNNLRIIIDSTLPNTMDCKVERTANETTLLINPNLLSKSDYEISEALFHDLTHVMSRIADSIHSDENNIIKKFIDTYGTTVRKMFDSNYDSTEFEDFDRNSPYFYTDWGFTFLDESIAQEVALEMLELKFGQKRNKSTTHCNYAPIIYKHDFSRYGIFQELAEHFAKTLRGINNLHDLAVASFEDNFVNNLIAEHTESLYTYETLYKELSYLGFISFVEYNYKGFLKNKLSFDPKLIVKIYNEALNIMIKGRDYRQKPTIYNRIYCNDFNAYWLNK